MNGDVCDNEEYWAVGTQMWYSAGYIIAPWFGTMRTHDQLKRYDIVPYNLSAEIYPEGMTLTGYHFTYDLYFPGGCGNPYEW